MYSKLDVVSCNHKDRSISTCWTMRTERKTSSSPTLTLYPLSFLPIRSRSIQYRLKTCMVIASAVSRNYTGNMILSVQPCFFKQGSNNLKQRRCWSSFDVTNLFTKVSLTPKITYMLIRNYLLRSSWESINRTERSFIFQVRSEGKRSLNSSFHSILGRGPKSALELIQKRSKKMDLLPSLFKNG